MDTKIQSGFEGFHIHLEDGYVLTGIPNVNNNKMSFWLTKEGMWRCNYCFSTLKGDVRELDYQLAHIDSHIRVFNGGIE